MDVTCRLSSVSALTIGDVCIMKRRFFIFITLILSLSLLISCNTSNKAQITDALMKLLASTQQIMEGECVLGIKDYGNIRLYAKKGEAGCEKTDATPALTLDRRAATRLLIGTLPTNAIATVPAILKAWLPLPMSWETLDFV